MNNPVAHINTTPEKISYYHLLLFVIALPYDMFFTNIILISFILHTLIHARWKKIKFEWNSFILVSGIFFLNLIGLIYTSDSGQATRDMQRQSAILLFPLLLMINPIDLNRYRKNLLIGLGISCTVAVIFLFSKVFQSIMYNNLSLRHIFSPSYINHNFTEPIVLHATYFSMYIALSLSVFIYFAFKSSSKTTRMFYLVGILILTAGLVQSGSRAVFIACIAIASIVFPLFLFTGFKRIKFVAITLLVTAVAVFGIIRISTFKNRYVTDLKKDLMIAENTNLIEPRIERWECALSEIAKSPVIGHGAGSEKGLLKECYYQNHLYLSYLNNLNAHNQYLSFLIKYGMVGLAVYLFTLWYCFLIARKKRDFLFCSFLVLIAAVSFSENILDVNKGIFFYSFFITMFVYSLKKGKIAKPRSHIKQGNLTETLTV